MSIPVCRDEGGREEEASDSDAKPLFPLASLLVHSAIGVAKAHNALDRGRVYSCILSLTCAARPKLTVGDDQV